MGSYRWLVAALLMAAALISCSGVTTRVNRRAESHVKFHASRQLECAEEKISARCAKQYGSGECYEYEITGCNAAIVYRNVNGGWTPGG